MALNTHSKFYYGIHVTESNRYIDCVMYGVPVALKLPLGRFAPSEFAKVLESTFSKADVDGTYSVTFDRVTKKFKFNILGTTTYDFKFLSGANSARSACNLLGFNKQDTNITTTTLAQNISIKEYKTQWPIQSYLSTEHNRKAIDGVVNKSASGVVEVVKFGNERFMEGELMFITDIPQIAGSVIRSNINGVQDYIDLIEWLTEKANIEIMIDENKPMEFQTFMLESTDKDSKGLDYELNELYDKGLALYYSSGLLKFRLME